MKDLVANRHRIGFSEKLRLAARAFSENGPVYTFLLATYYGSSAIAEKAFSRMARTRTKRGLPGINSIDFNKAIWESWDWKAAGEEWTVSEEWKQSLVNQVLDRYMPKSGAILEIGPGGGRWTEHLVNRCNSYVGIDLSASAIKCCEDRFADVPYARFLVGSGSDLRDVADASIDGIWSFNVFVHINKADVARYVKEFSRGMRKGATGVIHHGRVGGRLGGWRSDLTQDTMMDLLESASLERIDSFDEWSDGAKIHKVTGYADGITVFSKATE